MSFTCQSLTHPTQSSPIPLLVSSQTSLRAALLKAPNIFNLHVSSLSLATPSIQTIQTIFSPMLGITLCFPFAVTISHLHIFSSLAQTLTSCNSIITLSLGIIHHLSCLLLALHASASFYIIHKHSCTLCHQDQIPHEVFPFFSFSSGTSSLFFFFI